MKNIKEATNNSIWGIMEKANQLAFASGALMLFVLIFIISAETISRYLFSYSIGWGFEVTAYVMVASTFLCLGHILGQDGHLKITLLVDLLSEKKQRQLKIGVMVLLLSCGLIMLWASSPIAWEAYRSGSTSESAYRLLLWPYMSSVPLGCFLFSLQCITEIHRNIVLLRKMFPKRSKCAQLERAPTMSEI